MRLGPLVWIVAGIATVSAAGPAIGADPAGVAPALMGSPANCPAAPPASALAIPADAPFLDSDGRARVIGYNDMDEMLAALSARFSALNPAFRFALDLRSTRSAPPALTAGVSAFAPMGAEFTAEEAARFQARWGHEPLPIRVAHASLRPGALTSPLGVLVHRSNPLRRIRLAEVRRIFVEATGSEPVKTWGEIGMAGSWKRRTINRVGLAETTALGRYLLGGPLSGARFVRDYRRLPQSREVAAAVAADPSAIGLANLSHAGVGTRALVLVDDSGKAAAPTERAVRQGIYPFDRHLLIYVRRDAQGRVEPLARAFLGFVLSCEGQRIVDSGTRGYLRLNAKEIAAERRKLGEPVG